MLRQAHRACTLLSPAHRSHRFLACLAPPPANLHICTYTHVRRMASAAPAQTPAALAEEVTAQSALLTELRKTQGEGPAVEEAKKKLGELKRALALAQNASGGGGKEKKKERMLLKTAKVRPSTGLYVRRP